MNILFTLLSTISILAITTSSFASGDRTADLIAESRKARQRHTALINAIKKRDELISPPLQGVVNQPNSETEVKLENKDLPKVEKPIDDVKIQISNNNIDNVKTQISDIFEFVDDDGNIISVELSKDFLSYKPTNNQPVTMQPTWIDEVRDYSHILPDTSDDEKLAKKLAGESLNTQFEVFKEIGNNSIPLHVMPKFRGDYSSRKWLKGEILKNEDGKYFQYIPTAAKDNNCFFYAVANANPEVLRSIMGEAWYTEKVEAYRKMCQERKIGKAINRFESDFDLQPMRRKVLLDIFNNLDSILILGHQGGSTEISFRAEIDSQLKTDKKYLGIFKPMVEPQWDPSEKDIQDYLHYTYWTHQPISNSFSYFVSTLYQEVPEILIYVECRNKGSQGILEPVNQKLLCANNQKPPISLFHNGQSGQGGHYSELTPIN